MANPIERLEDGPVKEWYKNNIDVFILYTIVNQAEQNGYTLDPKSGLLIRNVYSDTIIKNLGYTIVDIIFPRPVDLHHHEDVDEALRIVDGEGVLHRYEKGTEIRGALCPGDERYIPKGMSHSFRPTRKNGFLEIRLACSGILNPEKEVCEERFDKYWQIEYNLLAKDI